MAFERQCKNEYKRFCLTFCMSLRDSFCVTFWFRDSFCFAFLLVLRREVCVDGQADKDDADGGPLQLGERVTEPDDREENGEEFAGGGHHGADERAVVTHCVVDEHLAGGAGDGEGENELEHLGIGHGKLVARLEATGEQESDAEKDGGPDVVPEHEMVLGRLGLADECVLERTDDAIAKKRGENEETTDDERLSVLAVRATAGAVTAANLVEHEERDANGNEGNRDVFDASKGNAPQNCADEQHGQRLARLAEHLRGIVDVLERQVREEHGQNVNESKRSEWQRTNCALGTSDKNGCKEGQCVKRTSATRQCAGITEKCSQ